MLVLVGNGFKYHVRPTMEIPFKLNRKTLFQVAEYNVDGVNISEGQNAVGVK